jgi:hypothetical protein
MKKTYATPVVIASDIVRATEIGIITTTSEFYTVWWRRFT